MFSMFEFVVDHPILWLVVMGAAAMSYMFATQVALFGKKKLSAVCFPFPRFVVTLC